MRLPLRVKLRKSHSEHFSAAIPQKAAVPLHRSKRQQGARGLIVLSQKVAGNRDQNQLLGEIHSADRGLTWVAKFQRTLNRGLVGMSRY
jgi:hypothetical protein